MTKAFSFILILQFLVVSICFTQSSKHTVTIYLNNVAGNKILNIDSSYINASGEMFRLRKFKYYISNIQLTDSVSGKKENFPFYFLVDEADSASKKILLQTYLHQITSIQFLLGVDSIKNVSGVQTGTLDPSKGMFWTWNSGYVMAKIEGFSPAANTAQHSFEWHVGGYKKNEVTAKKISLQIQDTALQKSNYFKINADVLKWFDGKTVIAIAKNPMCHSPGALAVSIADNYATMFSVDYAK